jgi:four helix bundle protein
MTIKSFEDIHAWQEAKKLVKSIYTLTGKGRLSKDFGLKDQIQRAAVSIMSNIAEGYESSSNNEFIRYLGYAKASAGETRSLLYVLHEIGCINEEEFLKIKDNVSHVSSMVTKFIQYLKRSNV